MNKEINSFNPLTLLKKDNNIIDFLSITNKDNYSLYISGTSKSSNYYLTYLKYLESDKSIIYIAPNTYKATHAYESFCALVGTDEVCFYCVDEVTTIELVAVSNDFKYERIKTLKNITETNKQIIVCNIQALLRPLMDISKYNDLVFTLKVSEDINISDFINKLQLAGYQKSPTCDVIGEFSIRGEIIDIYPIFAKNPIRINLFDTEIESIKYYDSTTQISQKGTNMDMYTIYPITDLIYDDYSKLLNLLENLEQTIQIRSDIDALASHNNPERISKYGKYLGFNKSFVDYLDNPICIFESINEIFQKHEALQIDIANLNKPDLDCEYYFDIYNVINNSKNVYLNDFTQSLNNVKLTDIIQLNYQNAYNYDNNLKYLVEDIRNNPIIHYICLDNINKIELLKSIFDENEIKYETNISKMSNVYIILNKNAIGIKCNRYTILTSKEIFNDYNKKIKFETTNQNIQIASKDDLKQGDYVVHYDYGIGIYKGLKTVEIENMKNDYLTVQYENMELYIPVEKITLLQKYQGTEGSNPKLSSVGSDEWKKKRERVKKKVESIAGDLLKVQAQRNSRKGYSYKVDKELINEFSNDFLFDETIDQQKAIDEIQKDMVEGKIIDRLVCGDVGYGKTEIALRAAFQTCTNSKQVLYLAPTTILTRQHFYTFKERFEKYGLTVRLLNRLVSQEEQTQTLKDLKNGVVDVLVGTHRVLSDDVKFKDLGLMIIDEEQRFGVTHKEKIKKLKSDINVLTLTATPIPRTLQMSMVGLRQFSQINTPPKDRYPIQTYVLEYNDKVIKEAIYKELSREGQVFYLHNKVEDIEVVVQRIKRLVPEARITFAHGRMEKTRLENKIQEFIDKKYDVLVCTTIIETGIDIPNSNTLIIDNVDRLGLSQLYQIRGRIGRSDKIAYAYLMYEFGKVLTDQAARRLNAIKEFTNLGSGYKIALRDLAIRGAGDILGKEQSGFIDTVGMQMYMKMLEDSMKKLKGEKTDEDIKSYNIQVSKHVSDKYVGDEEIKILIHEKINNVNNKEEKESLINELSDRFGKLSFDILLYIEERYLEKLLNKFEIEAVTETPTFISFSFPKHITPKIDGSTLFVCANKLSKNFYFEYRNEMLKVKLMTQTFTRRWIFTISRLLEQL